MKAWHVEGGIELVPTLVLTGQSSDSAQTTFSSEKGEMYCSGCGKMNGSELLVIGGI